MLEEGVEKQLKIESGECLLPQVIATGVMVC
jgi:hypothetical protein